jgi:hypothetical protein
MNTATITTTITLMGIDFIESSFLAHPITASSAAPPIHSHQYALFVYVCHAQIGLQPDLDLKSAYSTGIGNKKGHAGTSPSGRGPSWPFN